MGTPLVLPARRSQPVLKTWSRSTPGVFHRINEIIQTREVHPGITTTDLRLLELSGRTGRTPSPRFLVQTQRPVVRPASAMPFVNLPEAGSASHLSVDDKQTHYRRLSRMSRHTQIDLDLDDQQQQQQQQNSRRGSLFPSIDGRMLGKKANRKIQSTIHALYRMTGYGDPVSVITPQEDEAHFTAQDYSRTVRYPQSIRVAPSLARVIRNDVRGRVGRPRRKLIKGRLYLLSKKLEKSHSCTPRPRSFSPNKIS